jgi:hypothetical protein
MTGGGHCQREREKEMVPVRGAGKWVAGLIWGWARVFPRAFFMFFSSFSLFFLFSLFIHNFCILDPN